MVEKTIVFMVLSILILSSITLAINLPANRLASEKTSFIAEDTPLDSDVTQALKEGDTIQANSPASDSSSFSSGGCFGLSQPSVQKISKLKIAVIKPIFTATAYSDNAFYSFYRKWGGVQKNENVTSDLSSLNVTIADQWGMSQPLYDFLVSTQAVQCGLVMGWNLQVLDDADVTQGVLGSASSSPKFDVVILGFSEYVTIEEYGAYKRFVADGGALVLMDAANFVAQVMYYPSSNHLALVNGHGWKSNGRSVWRNSPFEYWQGPNANWVGSNFCCFEPADSPERATFGNAVANTSNPISVALRAKFGQNVFASYYPHEENAITNSTDSIIAYFPFVKGHPVAAYVHNYKTGHVIHIGFTGDDTIQRDLTVQYFLIVSLLYG